MHRTIVAANPHERAVALLGLAIVLLLVALLSLLLGVRTVPPAGVLDALTDYRPGRFDDVVIVQERLPRTLVGLCVGAALALAGAIAQSVARNPLADPSILGVSGGAAFAVVTAVYVLGLVTPAQYTWFALLGGLGAAALVYAIAAAGRAGATPLKLVLAGVIVGALASSWTAALLVLDSQTLDTVRFWLVGSLAGRDLDSLAVTGPLIALAAALAVLLARQLDVLALGDEPAAALGQRTARVRAAALAAVVVLAAAAVAAAGPIAFVGLAVPHLMRRLAGDAHGWLFAYCAVAGPILLLAADIAGRLVAKPGELEVGILTAVIGAPFLIVVARRGRGVEA
jgi:iron complex transport system permease protein